MHGNELDHKILTLFSRESSKHQAFDLLYEHYARRLYAHIRRYVNHHHDADDILQNVMVKVWRGLHNFRGDAQLATWLYRIASNESISFINSRKKQAMQSLNEHEEATENQLAAAYNLDGEKLMAQLMEAIAQLPEKQRQVFEMRYFMELSYQQIADLLQTSVGALKASYHHAAKKIQEYFANHD
ncbi:sigma-70 family RNA polymerase sigma factor [bacterium]|nr:sigma-70 family RNA polymerase sigma factor [bacterium]